MGAIPTRTMCPSLSLSEGLPRTSFSIPGVTCPTTGPGLPPPALTQRREDARGPGVGQGFLWCGVSLWREGEVEAVFLRGIGVPSVSGQVLHAPGERLEPGGRSEGSSRPRISHEKRHVLSLHLLEERLLRTQGNRSSPCPRISVCWRFGSVFITVP